MATTEISNQSTAPLTIKDWLQSPILKEQIAQALPKHVTLDRFMRILFTQCQKTPKLLDCTRESLFAAIIACSQLGIEPDGRRAHLIPYGTTCQLIIDYKGLAELAYRSGKVSSLHADIVCEHDEFEYDLGDLKKHKIDFRKPRGEMFAAYARVRFKDGSEKAEVLDKASIDAIRKRSKAGQSGPWVTDYNEMAKKTAFRRLSKWLPLSPEQHDAVEVDSDVIDIQPHAPEIRRPLFGKPAAEEDTSNPELMPGMKPAGEPLKPWQELAGACVDAGLAEADVMAYAFEQGAQIDQDENSQPFLKFSALSDESAENMIKDFAAIEKAVKAKKGAKK